MERGRQSQGRRTSDDLAEREEEATSKDTLKDVSEKEKTPASTENQDDKPPSPDGVPDLDRDDLMSDPMSDTL